MSVEENPELNGKLNAYAMSLGYQPLGMMLEGQPTFVRDGKTYRLGGVPFDSGLPDFVPVNHQAVTPIECP